MSDFIEHGEDDKTKKEYPNKIIKHSPSYYCWDGKWGSWTDTKVPDGPVCLVEVWDRSGRITIHPSRNPFWVPDPEQKRIWHELATGPFTDIMLGLRGGYAQPRPNASPLANSLFQLRDQRKARPQFPRPSDREFGKSENVPDWALEATNLVGYTCATNITWTRVGPNIKPLTKNLSLGSLPSVYYKHGHLTTDHKDTGNIGWISWGKCLFFGNVLVRYARKHQ